MEHRDALHRFLISRCRDHSEAEDALQELWLKLTSIAVPVAEPLAYLFRMADNLILDRRRSAQRRERRDEAWTDLAGGGLGGASDAPSPERALIAKRELEQVAQIFADLGDRTTEIFKSYRIDGVGQREIAEHHGISLSAVEKHLQKAYRAVLHLRDKADADSDAAGRLAQEEAN